MLRTMLRGSARQVRYVDVVGHANATGIVATVYEQLERDFGMLAPPMALHSAAPANLAAAWLMLREPLLADGLVDRRTKENVATAVSIGNSCPYCVAVHDSTTRALSGDTAEAAMDWAQATGRRATARLARPFPDDRLPEFAGVVVAFHYLNRMVNVFLPESPLPPAVPGALRGKMLGMMGKFVGAHSRKPVRPGAAADLLPPAPQRDDIAWATGNPDITDAFTRAATVIDQGRVPESVRSAVIAELSSWDGEPRGVGSEWLESAVSQLPAEDRAAGRLAMLTAFASYRVEPQHITEFGTDHGRLIELTAWASMATAREIGSWITPTRTKNRTG